MFDYTLVHWSAFVTAAVLLNISPGPDIAFILGHAVRNGRRGGFAAMFGIWSGAFLHVVLAAAGLSAVLASSAAAFSAVKWVGAAYLVWLGVRALRSRDGELPGADTARARVGAIYRQGVLVAALNPKVAVFFLAFLPQFVVDGAGPVWAQLFLHGSLIIVVAALVEPALVLAGSRLAAGLRRRPQIGLAMNRGLGALFVALGVRLAASGR